MKTVLITGASSGIGLEFSHIFAKNYYRVILVARDKDKLRALQKELHEKYGVEVVIVPKDLALTSAAEQVYTALKQANIEVDILVNNAGFGAYGKFSDIEPQRELEDKCKYHIIDIIDKDLPKRYDRKETWKDT